MKKVVAIVICFLLLNSPFCALSEAIDLDTMSLDQLIQLELDIQKKIYELDPMSKCVLYPGTYKVGPDIEVGDYLIQCVSLMDDAKYVRLAHLEESGYHLADPCLKLDDVCRIRFEEGQELEVLYGAVTFIKR